MNIIETVLLSLSLCVDSLVVATTVALQHRIGWRKGGEMAIVFTICQAFCPFVGVVAGDAARIVVENVAHWVAFVLLSYVGVRMIKEGTSKESAGLGGKHAMLNIGTMFMLGIATSIDAFAVGIGLGLQSSMTEAIWQIVSIALTTLVMSLLGVWLGRRKIPIPSKLTSIVAGFVLIALGLKAVVQYFL